MEVYKKVAQYITEHNLDITAIAKKCNIPPPTFNAMLNGSKKMYSDDLRAICFALKTVPEKFVDFQIEK